MALPARRRHCCCWHAACAPRRMTHPAHCSPPRSRQIRFQRQLAGGGAQRVRARLMLVDLAGSERASLAGAGSEKQKQGSGINVGLLCERRAGGGACGAAAGRACRLAHLVVRPAPSATHLLPNSAPQTWATASGTWRRGAAPCSTATRPSPSCCAPRWAAAATRSPPAATRSSWAASRRSRCTPPTRAARWSEPRAAGWDGRGPVHVRCSSRVPGCAHMRGSAHLMRPALSACPPTGAGSWSRRARCATRCWPTCSSCASRSWRRRCGAAAAARLPPRALSEGSRVPRRLAMSVALLCDVH